MKIKILALTSLALVFGACVTENSGETGSVTSEYEKITFTGMKATSAERQLCESVGGTVRPAGKLQAEHCIQNLADAGKACLNTSDCLGRCVIEGNGADGLDFGSPAEGVCEATDEQFGCTALVDGGKYQGTLCVD